MMLLTGIERTMTGSRDHGKPKSSETTMAIHQDIALLKMRAVRVKAARPKDANQNPMPIRGDILIDLNQSLLWTLSRFSVPRHMNQSAKYRDLGRYPVIRMAGEDGLDTDAPAIIVEIEKGNGSSADIVQQLVKEWTPEDVAEIDGKS
jgi:hypothetical protein